MEPTASAHFTPSPARLPMPGTRPPRSQRHTRTHTKARPSTSPSVSALLLLFLSLAQPHIPLPTPVCAADRNSLLRSLPPFLPLSFLTHIRPQPNVYDGKTTRHEKAGHGATHASESADEPHAWIEVMHLPATLPCFALLCLQDTPHDYFLAHVSAHVLHAADSLPSGLQGRNESTGSDSLESRARRRRRRLI